MKRRLLTLLLVSCITTFLNAQKVDLDRFNFSYEYRALPSNPLDSTFETYRIAITAPYSVTGVMDDDYISSLIKLEGYKKEKYTGDGVIRLTFEDIIIEKSEIIETVTTSKNKNGVETKTYRYYKNVDYTMQASCDFSDDEGNAFMRGITLLSNSGYNWSSPKYKTREEASNYYYNNRTALENRWVRERVKEAIENANQRLNKKFGFPLTKESSHLWLNDHRKHPETLKSKAMWSKLKPVLTGLSGNGLLENEIVSIMEAINYFNDIKITYSGDGKRDKKMRYSAYYNNAILYYILGNTEKMQREADGLIYNGFDTKDGERLATKAMRLKALYEKNNISTRHFKH